MDTLVALGTGAAWLYSTLVALAPGLFPPGTAGMYFDVAVIVITLVVLGQALEIRAKADRVPRFRSSCHSGENCRWSVTAQKWTCLLKTW